MTHISRRGLKNEEEKEEREEEEREAEAAKRERETSGAVTWKGSARRSERSSSGEERESERERSFECLRFGKR